jgi:TniQ
MRPHVRPLPVVLPPVCDELLSSWICRHAIFYGISNVRMLRHCQSDALSPRSLDLSLTRSDQNRLAEFFRCDPRSIRRMTHFRMTRHRPDVRPPGLIATARPAQICRRCSQRHKADELTRGAQLRSWMEGWRLSCPVCGSDLEDAGRHAAIGTAEKTTPFVARVLNHAHRGETLVDNILRWKWRLGGWLSELMRVLLMPRKKLSGSWRISNATPRVLNVVVPGFDDYVREHYADFRLSGTLLLPMNMRRPLLAGVSRVVAQPAQWVEHLLGAAGKPAQKRVWVCLERLATPHSTGHVTSTCGSTLTCQ